MSDHDPCCPAKDGPERCRCTFIARARADERARWSPPAPAVPGHAAFCWCDRCQMAEQDAEKRTTT